MSVIDLRRYRSAPNRTLRLREDSPEAHEPKPLTRGQKQYRRMRERMAVDPEYRERKLRNARAASKRHYERNRVRLAATQRARDRERYALDRDAILAKRRAQYVGAAAESIRARNRAWYARNRDKKKAYNRRYREENGDRIRAHDRERERKQYAEDPRVRLDYYKMWRARNLERARAYVRVSNLKRRAAIGSFSVDEWFALLERYDYRCAYCGSPDLLEADHRIPLVRGGPNTIDNILPACRSCNRRKNRKTETEFRALLAKEAAARAASSASPLPPDEEEAVG